jgi:hypothetical protein
MASLHTSDLRSNVGTWAVPTCQLPALTRQMLKALSSEKFDPDFDGQYLETTYFDTKSFKLRKARVKGNKYVTIRIRCYPRSHATPLDRGDLFTGAYAISAKTESQKFRQKIDSNRAESLLGGGIVPSALVGIMPPDLIARIVELSEGESLHPVVTLCFRRYAVEDNQHRLTLDTDIESDTGRHYPSHVLEQKSTNKESSPIITLPLRPIKLSKFLWATQ